MKNPIHIRCHGSIGKVKPEYFSKSRRGDFFQEQPVLSNPFENDKFLQRCLKRLLPEEVSKSCLYIVMDFLYLVYFYHPIMCMSGKLFCQFFYEGSYIMLRTLSNSYMALRTLAG